MIFTEAPLPGAFILDVERLHDDRGYFARTFCQREFAAHGLDPVIAQTNLAFSHRAGSLRGMHFQFPPVAGSKVVRCSSGAIFDVIVDLRPESPTYLQHFAIELSAGNGRALYVPARFAHGYQSLEERSEATYLMGEFYTPGAEGGLLYTDPRLSIPWPRPVTDISARDRAWPLLEVVEPSLRERMTMPVPAANA